MTQIKERVVELLMKRDGLTDREVTDLVLGRGAAQQSINQICRELERKGIITRKKKMVELEISLLKTLLYRLFRNINNR